LVEPPCLRALGVGVQIKQPASVRLIAVTHKLWLCSSYEVAKSVSWTVVVCQWLYLVDGLNRFQQLNSRLLDTKRRQWALAPDQVWQHHASLQAGSERPIRQADGHQWQELKDKELQLQFVQGLPRAPWLSSCGEIWRRLHGGQGQLQNKSLLTSAMRFVTCSIFCVATSTGCCLDLRVAAE
jgi:hypothetical protein